MLEKPMGHSRGMRLLIVALYAYAIYLVINAVSTFLPLIRQIQRAQADAQRSVSDGQPRLFSTGADNPGTWEILLAILPTVLVSLTLSAGSATGLLLGRRWGWWLAAVFCVTLLLPGLPLVIYQFFIFNGGTLAAAQPDLLARQFLILGSGIVALCYLCSKQVMATLQVDRSRPGNIAASLIGLAFLVFLTNFIPAILIMLVALVTH